MMSSYMGYTRKAVEGFSWLSVLKIITKIFAVVKIVLLARLLTPRDFGLFGLAAASLGLVERLTETGINTFLVQKKDHYASYLNSAWVIAIFRGMLISILILISVLFLPKFYNEPQLVVLLFIASTIPLIKGFINPAVIQYWKFMNYNKDVYLRGFLAFVEVVSSIVLAFVLRSPAGLLLALCLSAIIEVIISHTLVKPSPRFMLDWKKVKEILRIGSWLNIGGFLAFCIQNVDDLIIGKLLGTQRLGLYQTAYKVTQSSIGDVGELGAQTVFPIYTRIRDDRWRLQRAFFRALLPLALVLLIPSALLLLYPTYLVSLVLGSQWLAIVPVLPFLVLAMYVQALNAVMYPIYLAIERPQFNVIILMINFVAMVGLILTLSPRYGLVGTGVAVITARLMIQPLFIFFLHKSFALTKKKS